MTENELTSAAEERAARRQRVLLKGQIAFNEQFSSVPCTVRDLSETGAKLRLDSPMPTPDRFTLHVEVGGWKVECERIWLEGLTMGVRFTGERTKSRLSRDQMLQTSEEALSDRVLRDMELRDSRQPARSPQATEKPVPDDQPAHGRPVFGRR